MNRPPILAGLALVALGLVLLLHELGVVDAGEVLATWWPLLVVAAGVVRLTVPPRSRLGGALLLVLGGALLLWRLGVVQDLGLVWPALLLLAGVWLLVGRGTTVVHRSGTTVAESVDGKLRAVTILGERKLHSPPGPFDGGSVVTVLGDLDLDLTTSEPATPVVTVAGVTVLGDLDLIVPAHWRVTSVGLTLLGDVDVGPPAPAQHPDGTAPELRLDIVTVLGDVTVRRAALAP